MTRPHGHDPETGSTRPPAPATGDRFDVVVVGAGPAGCAVATLLALAGARVAILEKRNVPTHKLCGEFLSPEARVVAARMGALDAILLAGAVPIGAVCMTSSSGGYLRRAIPRTALGVTRYALDRALLDGAVRAGAAAYVPEAARSIAGGLEEGFRVESSGRSLLARTVVGAWGRSDRLDARLQRHDANRQGPWVAFKAHYEGDGPRDAIELHLFNGGYCGVSPVESGRTNVCWIAHRDVLRAAGGDATRILSAAVRKNRALGARLGGLDRVSKRVLSAGNLRFIPRAAFARDVCLVGDAAGMIAPLCGDGMAMAIDGAALAAEAVLRFLDRGDPAAFRAGYASAWRRRFARRMFVGRALHAGLTREGTGDAGLRLAARQPWLADALIRATRG